MRWSLLLSQNDSWVSYLIQLLPTTESACVIVGNMVGDESSASICPTLRQAGMIPALIAALNAGPASSAAAWALTNAIRHDTNAWGMTYVGNDPQLLSPALLEHLLTLRPTTTTVATTQAAWMVASLMSREPEVVDYLVQHASFCSTLVQCLEQSSKTDDPICVPLVQALGHVASQEAHVAPLLVTTSLLPLVARLLQQPHSRELTLQLAWLAGCLLVDAGWDNHPSTVMAAPSLVPILFQRLGNNNNNGSSSSSLEEQREFTSALWNALSTPPTTPKTNNTPSVVLVPIPLPALDVIRPSFTTLVSLISGRDADAVLAAVHVTHFVLLHLDDRRLQTALEEESIVTALEAVCDHASEAADVAADLLDDFFYNGDDEDMISNNGIVAFPAPPSGMGRGRGATLPSWMPDN